MLEVLALILAGVHFGVPLIYYWYMKSKYLNRSWDVKVDGTYKPKVTIIVPTYNEAEFIWEKLDDIYVQNYPKDLMEVVIVDSASEDGTAEIVEEWASKHRDIDLKLIEEKKRRGKLSAIFESLRHVSPDSDVVVFTDADAFWDSTALSRAIKYFADSSVGAVTASMVYSEGEALENVYRDYYNIIRVSESKIYSTPVHNGPFLVVRAGFIRKFGLPAFPGSDDSGFGSYIAFSGLRAIQVDEVMVKEPVKGSQFRRKIRRAQHLLLNFLKTKRCAKKLGVYRCTKPFEKIWKVEWWLHVVNPWLLIICAILLVMGMFYGSIMAPTLLGVGLIFLTVKAYRAWIMQQLYLIVAAVRNLWTREVMWSK